MPTAGRTGFRASRKRNPGSDRAASASRRWINRKTSFASTDQKQQDKERDEETPETDERADVLEMEDPRKPFPEPRAHLHSIESLISLAMVRIGP